MSADITCGRAGGALISMKHCENCYYKRIKEDVSTLFCKYRISMSAKETRINMINRQKQETEDLCIIRDRHYTMGRPRLAEDIDRKVKESQKKYKELLMINEAIAHITEQAMKIAEQPGKRAAIIKIEEHLTAKCTSEVIAAKLLNKEKSLDELYTSIEKKAKEMAKGTTCVVLTSEEVFNMVDDYYDIADATDRAESAPAEVNIFDLL